MNPTDEERVRAARAKVRARPPLDAVERPGPGEESVWRYPRPPRLEPVRADVAVALDAIPVARSRRAWRVVETSSPPAVYLPEDDLLEVRLHDRDERALCEWKGWSTYVDLEVGGRRVEKAGWRFHDPFDDLGQDYGRLRGLVALFPALFDCRIDRVIATAQDGGYYGGWVTPAVKGPFKGGPGTEDW